MRIATGGLPAAALSLAMLALSGWAAADAVPAPPKDCPPGTWGRTDHYGQYCAAYGCSSDDACQGLRCVPYALCIKHETYEHPRGNTSRSMGLGPCDQGQACPEGSQCEPGRYCMAASATTSEPPATTATSAPTAAANTPPSTSPVPATSAPPPSGCSRCSAQPSASHGPQPAWWAAGLALLALARRRHRASTAPR